MLRSVARVSMMQATDQWDRIHVAFVGGSTSRGLGELRSRDK